MNTILMGLAARPVMNGIAHSFFAAYRGAPAALGCSFQRIWDSLGRKSSKGLLHLSSQSWVSFRMVVCHPPALPLNP
jgi:hypothetical protein